MPLYDYLDLDLEIGEQLTQYYPVEVNQSPIGRASGQFSVPFDKNELASRLKDIEIAVLQGSLPHRQVLSPQDHAVRTFGTGLFDALFSGEVLHIYDESRRTARSRGKGLRIRLKLSSPELSILPWEYLFDQREAEYISLSNQTPLIRYISLRHVPEPPLIQPPLRILGIVSSPRGLTPLNVLDERRRLEHAVQRLRKQGLIELMWLDQPTYINLQHMIQQGPWHAIHFIGHGGFNSTMDEGFLALVDNTGDLYRCSATQVARLLGDHIWLRFVVLNSCQGARGSARDNASSIAGNLVRRGVPAVLAMQYPITDSAAIALSEAFYGSLSNGLPLDTAVVEARKRLSSDSPGSYDWGTAVLVMSASSGDLFDRNQLNVQERKHMVVDNRTMTNIDKRALREAMTRVYSIDELEILCADIETEMLSNGIVEQVNLDMVGGTTKTIKILNLIDYLNRRGYLGHLIEVIRKTRPGAF